MTRKHSLNITELYTCWWKHCFHAASPRNIEWCFIRAWTYTSTQFGPGLCSSL